MLFTKAIEKPLSLEDFRAWLEVGVGVTSEMLKALVATGIAQDTLRKIILALLDVRPEAMETLRGAHLFSGEEVIMAALQKMVDGDIQIDQVLAQLDPEDITFKVAMKAVEVNAGEFQYVPRDIEGYEKIVWATVKRWVHEEDSDNINASFVRSIPPDFDGIVRIRHMLLNSSRPDRTMYGFDPHDIPPALALKAVKRRPKCLQDIPPTLRRYLEIVQAAIEAETERKGSCQGIIKYIHRELFSDPEFAMNLVKACPQTLRYIPPTIPNFSEMARLAVKTAGGLLRHVPYETEGYYEIAENAVQENYMAISFVRIPSNSSAYRDLLMKAMKNNYRAIAHAARECRDDPNIAIAAIRENPRAIRCVHKVLRHDIPRLLSACANKQEEIEIAASILRTVDDLDPETMQGLLQYAPE